MDALNLTQRVAANVARVRDANPDGWILASVADYAYTPMRTVAFDDLNADREVGIPLILATAAEAEARAAAWNTRLPEGYRPALSIAAYPVGGWSSAFMDTLDYDALAEGAVDVEMPSTRVWREPEHMLPVEQEYDDAE